MTSFFQDIRYAFRTFRRAPAFALIAVATLALGIGANTAIFSVVDAVLLRPLPYPHDEQVMVIQQTRIDGKGGNWSYADLADVRDQQKTFSDVVAAHEDAIVMTGQGAPQRLDAMAASGNLFRMLQVDPMLGRGFAPGEDVAGKNHVAVLGHAAWVKRFGADPGVIGRTVTFDDQPTTIIGVLPASFNFAIGGGEYDVFVPTPRPLDVGLFGGRGAHYLNAIGRLAPGVDRTRAQADLVTIGARLAAEHPEADSGRSAVVIPLRDELVRELRPALLLLLGAVGFVLLIACANVANILLARATARQHELAIRFALGASRARVLRQLLTESVLLALAGGAVGVVLAMWGLDALRTVLPDDIARIHPLAVDGRILAFTAGIAVVTGLVFGLLPALHGAAGSPSEALKDGSRGTATGARQRARSVLVAAEVAIALLLLVGAGVTLKSFHNLASVDPGFNPRDLVTTDLALPDARYAENEKVAAFYRALKQRVEAMPGVQAVAIGMPLPYSNANVTSRFSIVGRPAAQPGHEPSAAVKAINSGYFAALQIPVVRGRVFTDAEDAQKARPVGLVNQAFVRRYFPDSDPLGEHLAVGFQDLDKDPMEIIGVVADTRGTGLAREPSPEVYFPFAVTTFPYIQIAARTTATVGFEQALRAQVAAVDAEQPLGEIATMSGNIGKSISRERLSTLLLGIFGAVALALALIGVYGVMSYTVTQRFSEIGIRMALGARPVDVTRMVVRHGLTLAAIGVGIGVAGAAALGRLIAGMLFGVSALDPTIFAGAAAALLGIAALASWLPARRAAKVDPMIALRSP